MVLSLPLLTACDSIIPSAPAGDEILDGPVAGLSHAQQSQFLAGDIAFNDEVFTPETGLGPIFVATSCGSCHAGDGKGHPFTTLTRFGQTDSTGNPFIGRGGPQLQNRAIPGYIPEQLPVGVKSMQFTPPAVTGLGFLSALTDEQILAYADPNDANGDGISGVPNYITPPPYFQPQWFHRPVNGKYIGRFGRKAGAIDLMQQTIGAYNQDMGITSTFDPIDVHTHLSGDPEVSDNSVRNVVFYLRALKAPIQRTSNDARVANGKKIFSAVQCGSCHIPEWTTPESDIASLSNKPCYPYTDLLMHDMGSELDDGATEGTALTSEWKTTPLWGLGLSANSQGGQYYLMHDGRARSIEAAILLHGGEGSRSRSSFQQLSASDKADLIRFLESL
jgi:CxxC motif-containing protein (DUF1111 family)